MKPNDLPNHLFPNTYKDRVTHYLELQKTRDETFPVDIKTNTTHPKSERRQPSSHADLFRLAKQKILESYPESKRAELLEMEKNKSVDTDLYNQFVKNICQWVEKNS